MIPPTLTIRQATEADYEQLCDLFAELDTGPRRTRAHIARLIAGPNSAIYVAAERDARVLHGVATLLRDEPGAQFVSIGELVVHRDARRQGIGRALIDRAADWAARKGCELAEGPAWRTRDRERPLVSA